MFNRCLIMLTAVLSTSCGLPPYKPSAEALGPNPATLRVIKVSSDITRSSMSILQQEVNCKNPGETATRITSLGYTENPDFEALSQQPPYSVQIPSKQPVLIDLGFRKNFPAEVRICDIAFSFIPEPGAVYLLDRRFDTSFFNDGTCSFELSRVTVTEQGETMEKLKDYLWGPLAGFETGRYICDESGNYSVKLPKRTRRPMDKVMKGAEQNPSAKGQARSIIGIPIR